jgi:hypothetical protein
MGRDIQAVKISGEERRVYGDKLRRSLDVLARMLRDRMFEDSPSQVGLEIELNLVGGQMAPSMRNAQVLDAVIDPDWETELGQFNLEINVRPRQLAGNALVELEQQLRRSLNAADLKARGTGSRGPDALRDRCWQPPGCGALRHGRPALLAAGRRGASG